ncbi:MAG: SufS family cysteine desulfurase [Gammaproteobacteria bacterium]|nr:SufS family cysteine desulfurase [Gammaproteobacteria bacterium]
MKIKPFDVFDSAPVLADVPLLAAAGESLHYLDNAATTQKPNAVIDAISDCYRQHNAPVHRGLYDLAENASQLYETARRTLAKFIGAASDQLIFTRSATESINMVAQGWLRPRLNKGDQIWLTRMEHHANYLPWQALCRDNGARLRIIELNQDGTLDLENCTGLYDASTKLIALTQVSNVLGVINPLKEICAKAAGQGIAVMIDAAQSVGHMPVDVTELDCDFLVFSAHKMFGPNGIGALYGKAERLNQMEPLLLGGGMVDHVSQCDSIWMPYPTKFEAGSQNLADALGFAAAVNWIRQHDMHAMHAHVTELTQYALDSLAKLNNVEIYGPRDAEQRAGIVSFNLTDVHPHDVGQIAGERGVAIRAGHHCCQPLMQQLGIAATARASFAPYNNRNDVDALIESLHAAQALMG